MRLKWHRSSGLCFVILLLLGCNNTEPQVSRSGVELGDAFPELNLVSLSGDEVRLSEFMGKLVVLNVWATWCPPCRKELPSLESLSALLDGDKFAVLGLSIDEDKLLVKEYLTDKDIKLPVYFNAEGTLDYQALGIGVFPYTFIIGPDGKLLSRYPGEKVWNSASEVRSLQAMLQQSVEK